MAGAPSHFPNQIQSFVDSSTRRGPAPDAQNVAQKPVKALNNVYTLLCRLNIESEGKAWST